MQKNSQYLLLMAGVIGASGLFITGPADAQDILQRIQARREAREEAGNLNQNQNAQLQPGNRVAASPVPSADVSMVTLKTQSGPDGQQMVLTPKGYVVPLPGPGVNGPAVQIFMGSSGGYWYVDKNNQQVDLTNAVQKLQAKAAQMQTTAQAPQYAPPPQMYAQPVSAATTAAAAGLGAMAGAAIADNNASWNTIPYGSAIRYGGGAMPYYNQGGKAVYINNSKTANVNDINGYHAAAINEQQNWYKRQQVTQSENYKTWQQPVANPFVNEGSMAAVYGVNAGQQEARYGAAAGATAAHYGAVQGEDSARRGEAAGLGAAHYGQEQGEESARRGAAAGAHASNDGGGNRFGGGAGNRFGGRAGGGRRGR